MLDPADISRGNKIRTRQARDHFGYKSIQAEAVRRINEQTGHRMGRLKQNNETT